MALKLSTFTNWQEEKNLGTKASEVKLVKENLYTLLLLDSNAL